jgi:DNA (cytosine-5)-methyltransferase 1
MRNGRLRPAADMDLPSVAESLPLFPSPRATDGTKGGPNQRGSSGDMMLPSALPHLALFRTPTAQLAVNGGSQHPSKRRGGGHGPTLADEVEHELDLLPSPAARDFRSGKSNLLGRNARPLNEVAEMLLQPESAGAGGKDLLPTPTASLGEVAATAEWKPGVIWWKQSRAACNVAAIAESLPVVAGVVDWGKYARGVLRWEQVTGRLVPCPLQPGRNGNVLAPAFVEWMMGLPEGWVTDLGLSRTAMLRILGNGVVWQQAVLGLTVLWPRVIAACPTL